MTGSVIEAATSYSPKTTPGAKPMPPSAMQMQSLPIEHSCAGKQGWLFL
jgi:hypothetical protein